MAIQNTFLLNEPTAISPGAIVVNTQFKDIAITMMLFCNLNEIDPLDPDAGKQFLDIYVVPKGGEPSPVNQIAKQIPVDAGDTFAFNVERLVLSAGDFESPGDRVFASATNTQQVSATISYIVI